MENLIDSHVHITDNGKWMKTTKDASLQRLIKEMKLASVRKAILIAVDGLIPNEFIYKMYQENKDLFVPFCSINPITTSITNFQEIIKKGEFIGIKIHPRLQNFSLKDRRVIDFFKNVESIPNFLLLLDCWFSEKDPYNIIEETINFVNSFKKLKIILAHAGGFYFDSIMPLLIKNNILIDLSYTPLILKKYNEAKYNEFFAILKKSNLNKVLFGSDFPEFSIKECVDFFKTTFNNFNFSESDQEKIFHKNIEELLNKIIKE